MALTTAKTKGIRKLADGQAPTIRADIAGIVDDIGAAAWPNGTVLPSAAADKWPGRLFFHDTEDTLYVCSDSLVWLPVGGLVTVDLAALGAPAAGYSYDTAGGASYAWRSGKRVDLRLRIKRTSGVLVHGEKVFQVSTAFLPSGAGAWPLAAVQAGGAAAAAAVGGVLDAAGSVHPLSPNGTSTTLEVNGSYYIP